MLQSFKKYFLRINLGSEWGQNHDQEMPSPWEADMQRRQASSRCKVTAGGHSCSHRVPQDGSLARSKPLPGTKRPSRSCLGREGQVGTSVREPRAQILRTMRIEVIRGTDRLRMAGS